MRQILFCILYSIEEHGNQKLQVSNKTFSISDFCIPQRNTKIRSYKLVIKLYVFLISAFWSVEHGYRNLHGFAHSTFRVPHCSKRKSNSDAFGHLEDLGTDLDKLWAVFCSFISYGHPCSCIFCLGSNQIPQNYTHR